MKVQSIALALATVLSTAAAQSMTGLPDCAKTCATGAIPSKCNMIDVECICGTKTFITDISCCVAKKCSASDQKAALEFAQEICSGAGVTDLPSSATCENSTSTTAAATTSTTTTTNSQTSDESTSTKSSTETETGSTATSTTASGTASETTASTQTASASASATHTGGAAVILGKDMGVLAGVAAGVAFFM
ncbi:hypothetical protein P175DRAFT_0502766 [Aspergillus ochraceoroseus IBT 24754]|uniref:CFEM domain-containing protein n=3 Tax=Aspergillus subgen. Nidulantes TaxID=2720870 RepID=A0A0F8X697_9EURO|nr:uncharacterized protein P175DRAFT_0502766 [Aspergillus ochraceoroseus IBT 24754]KKK12172.1 hypothetical protein AOCH_004069 [Aspergillus ochraceoroseus]KKK25130.1 hypothetical protein ARAM_003471 [Aspergillus rambellii]PTU19245.1 hypothetical protein P175DRAFT_0502766 [Aspergillus ochraceoroseus IBT 24754]